MTTVTGVQTCALPIWYPQAEFAQKVADQVGLDPAQRARLERLYGNAGVDTRHTILPMAEYGALGGIGPANDRYIEEATDLGEQALRGALDAAGLAARDVDLLIVTSVTGVAVPSLDARLIPRLGLRPDVKRLPIFGLGCVAGAAGLGRLHDYLLAWPQHTVALLAVELCSLTWRPTDVTVADLVASSLFGDGAVALVATGGRGPDTRAAGRPRGGGLGGHRRAGPRRAGRWRPAGRRLAQPGVPRQRRHAGLAAGLGRLPDSPDGGAGRRG